MVPGAAQHVAPRPSVLLAADVVAGSDVVGAENGGAREDRPELDVLVAPHAGVRGPAALVLPDKIGDDRLAE